MPDFMGMVDYASFVPDLRRHRSQSMHRRAKNPAAFHAAHCSDIAAKCATPRERPWCGCHLGTICRPALRVRRATGVSLHLPKPRPTICD